MRDHSLIQYQKIAKTEYNVRSYTSEKAVIISGFHKNDIKCYCIDGSIVNGARRHLFSLALD